MAENRFGREAVKKPTCPFCGLPLARPRELDTRMPNEMPLGTCSCGAVFACDETGHNLGIAQLDALLFSCNMDSDLAWGLLPDDDYREAIVERYDRVNHLIVPSGVYEGRRISGALFFIRLHADVREVTAEGVEKRFSKTPEIKTEKETAPAATISLSKKDVEKCVNDFDAETLLEAARGDKKILRHLQRMLYSGDDLFRKKAAELLGLVCAQVGRKDPGAVSKLLQGLFTAVGDTAAFTWGAFEAIGEIISRKTDLFGGYIPYLYQYLQDETRKAQAIETMGRIAIENPALLRKVTFRFLTFLDDPDPRVRGYSAWLLGNLRAYEAMDLLEKMLKEKDEVQIYGNGRLESLPISKVVSESIEKIRNSDSGQGR